MLEEELPIPKTWPKGFDCPLIPSATKFDECRSALGLTSTAAQILDDVRFLATLITQGEDTPTKLRKARSTATWLHSKLKQMPSVKINKMTSDSMCIQETIRLAALIHSWSVSNMAQISGFNDKGTIDRAYTAMRSVSLTRWKSTPGIFLWIMLVAAPNTKQDVRGRFIRRKMAVSGLSIGFEDFHVGTSYLRAFWLIQRWISRERKQTT